MRRASVDGGGDRQSGRHPPRQPVGGPRVSLTGSIDGRPPRWPAMCLGRGAAPLPPWSRRRPRWGPRAERRSPAAALRPHSAERVRNPRMPPAPPSRTPCPPCLRPSPQRLVRVGVTPRPAAVWRPSWRRRRPPRPDPGPAPVPARCGPFVPHPRSGHLPVRRDSPLSGVEKALPSCSSPLVAFCATSGDPITAAPGARRGGWRPSGDRPRQAPGAQGSAPRWPGEPHGRLVTVQASWPYRHRVRGPAPGLSQVRSAPGWGAARQRSLPGPPLAFRSGGVKAKGLWARPRRVGQSLEMNCTVARQRPVGRQSGDPPACGRPRYRSRW